MVDTLGTLKTSVGLGSGIDIANTVQRLIEAEGKFKKDKYDAEEAKALAKITAYGNLKSALSSFKDSLDTLKSSSKFQARTANITNDSTVSQDTKYFTATANNTAIPATYTFEVEQLAQAHKLGSAIFADESSIVGTGTLSITVGAGQSVSNTYDFTIDSNNNSLSGIKSLINQRTATTGVSATIITSDAGKQLVITSNNPGVKNTLGIAVTNDADSQDSDNSGLSQLITANMTELIAPQDANVRIDGQLVTASSNTLVDVIEGVNIDLLKAEDGKIHSLNIATDRNAAKGSVSKFVQSYNELVSLIGDLTKVNQLDPSSNGELLGDATLRNIGTQIRSGLLTVVSSNLPEFNALSAIGVTTDFSSGELKIDSSKLDNALANNFDAVGKLFSSEKLEDGTDGVAVVLYDVVDNIIKANGVITTTTDILNKELKDIADEKLKLDNKLKQLEVDYTKQFAALDALLGNFQATQSQLTQQLSNFVEPLSFKK